MDKNKIAMVSPCGINCADCAGHLAKEGSAMMEKMLSLGFKKEGLPCPGCRDLKGNCPVIGGACETYACVEKKGIDFCYECADFPCYKLAPAADKAGFALQNTKLFNLCCIQRQGLEKWLEMSSEIKRKYFRDKLIFGKGPRPE